MAREISVKTLRPHVPVGGYLGCTSFNGFLDAYPMTHIQLPLLLMEFLRVLPYRNEKIGERPKEREEIDECGGSCASCFTELLKSLFDVLASWISSHTNSTRLT